ncbi:S-adenosyl-L-methionine-dependent methyltransferase [Stachybotrys elegans]|uniref:S-adenosyl-L-methionine-dependent methyltransferase n=1 Tax=Stachybotrys elegans TaxID=80388 RepID=A0A8K0SM46_9HYPO|nr:S-adenosyl-L-methionine-dependent methyltransferase [Stachybotrys elegans]
MTTMATQPLLMSPAAQPPCPHLSLSTEPSMEERFTAAVEATPSTGEPGLSRARMGVFALTDGRVRAPNDDTQNESLDIIHHVLTLMLDGNIYRAPLGKNIENVVDIGTGTGIWAIDFADKYPDAKVIGTDLSPIQPSWVPPNIDFQIDDCTQPWTFEENSLDYVHIRWLFGSIKDWTELFKQAYRCLKPGGWLETHEASVQFSSDDGSVHDKTAMGQFGSLFIEGGKKMGRWMTIIEDGVQRKSVEEANFVNIHEEDFKTPIGTWPKDRKQKEIGSFQQLAVEQDTEGSLIYIAGLQGWTQEEVRVYIKHLKKEFRDPAIHGYYKQKIVWAQKPAE